MQGNFKKIYYIRMSTLYRTLNPPYVLRGGSTVPLFNNLKLSIMNFEDIFYQFDVEGKVVMFPKAIFTDVEKLKRGEEPFAIRQTAKGAWLAIKPVEEIKINFQLKVYKREE